jgi:hypothetical protein
MFTELDTLVAVVGFTSVLVGIYLWLGIAASLILLGLALVFISMRLDLNHLVKKEKQHGPD